MKDLGLLLTADGRFSYTHENIKIVNALGRNIEISDYRDNEAGIVDTENFFVYVFPRPKKLTDKLGHLFKRYAHQDDICDIACAHCEFVAIHPFPNGNGRVARFIADINLTYLGIDPFLNGTIDRTRYYGAVRDYLEGDGPEKMISLIEDSR